MAASRSTSEKVEPVDQRDAILSPDRAVARLLSSRGSEAIWRRNRMKRLFSVLAAGLLTLGLVGGATAAGPTNYIAFLSGDNEIPVRATDGHGVAIFHLSPDGTELRYRLNVDDINNVVASHIHLGTADVNGPVVLFLFTAAPAGGAFEGTISSGTATAADLVGPLAGMPLSALIAAMDSGAAYVNVHTNDGVAPTNTGPGDFPGGEIRGQVEILNP
jgi:hypothetical protein